MQLDKSHGVSDGDSTRWSTGLTTRHTACSATRQRKGVAAALAEKKISILQRGLEFHPGSDQLLLALLNEVRCCVSLYTVSCPLPADTRQVQLCAAEGSASFVSIWLVRPRAGNATL